MSIHPARSDHSPTPDPNRKPSHIQLPPHSPKNGEKRSLPYPSHVAIHPDAEPHIRAGFAITFSKLDEVIDAITSAVARRLPRRPDAYRYVQSRATDVIKIVDLGLVSVELTQTGRGVFSYVSAITGPGFYIRNCRYSGRTYASKFNDLSRVHEISIDSLGFRVRLYSDLRGVSVETFKGLTYSSNPAETAPQPSRNAQGTLCLTRTSLSSLQKRFYQFGGEQALFLRESLALELEYPLTMKWNYIQRGVAKWLEENILLPLNASPAPTEQLSILPS